MKKLVIMAIVLLFVTPAFAQQTLNYSWEDGGTILGSYGNLCCEANVSGPQTGSQGSLLPDYTCPGAVDGEKYLHVAEDPHSSTPQAFLAWVTGLNDGDMVDAMFYGFDITAGSSPSWRIWGHYSDSVDITTYLGSAGGSDLYTEGLGWDLVSHTFAYMGGDGNALVFTITPVGEDGTIQSLQLHWILDKNPLFEDAIRTMPAGSSTLIGTGPHGWDQGTGRPTRAKLEELGLSEVAEELAE